MKNFVFGMVVGVSLLLVVVVGYFLSGSAPVATDAPSMPMEKYLAKKALHGALDREMAKTSPIKARHQILLPRPLRCREGCSFSIGTSPDFTLNAISLFFKSNLMCVR